MKWVNVGREVLQTEKSMPPWISEEKLLFVKTMSSGVQGESSIEAERHKRECWIISSEPLQITKSFHCHLRYVGVFDVGWIIFNDM